MTRLGVYPPTHLTWMCCSSKPIWRGCWPYLDPKIFASKKSSISTTVEAPPPCPSISKPNPNMWGYIVLDKTVSLVANISCFYLSFTDFTWRQRELEGSVQEGDDLMRGMVCCGKCKMSVGKAVQKKKEDYISRASLSSTSPGQQNTRRSHHRWI